MATPSFTDFRNISEYSYTPYDFANPGSQTNLPTGWGVPLIDDPNPDLTSISLTAVLSSARVTIADLSRLSMDVHVVVKDGAAVLAFSGTKNSGTQY